MNFFNKYLRRLLALSLALLMLTFICACSSSDVSLDDLKKDSATADEASTAATNSADTTPEADASLSKDAKYVIGIVMCADDQASFDAYNGFTDTFIDHDTDKNGTHHEVRVANYASVEMCKEYVESYVRESVDVIFAIGENAVTGASQVETDIPVIFCNIDDPKGMGLMTSTVNPDKNITGVCDLTPVDKQIPFINTILPDAKNISTLHFATDADSILVANLAQKEADALGLTHTSYSANNATQLAATLDKALKDADVLYVCEDELTLANIDAIMQAADKKKVPVITTGTEFMAKGALATTQPDYYKLGYSAGELALIYLTGIKPISGIAVEYPVDCINYVNRAVAQTYSVTLPETGFVYFGEE